MKNLAEIVMDEAYNGTLEIFREGWHDAKNGKGRDTCPYEEIHARIDGERVMTISGYRDAWLRGWDRYSEISRD